MLDATNTSVLTVHLLKGIFSVTIKLAKLHVQNKIKTLKKQNEVHFYCQKNCCCIFCSKVTSPSCSDQSGLNVPEVAIMTEISFSLELVLILNKYLLHDR